MGVYTLPLGGEPKWLRDWRCPHCGSPAVRFNQTVSGESTQPVSAQAVFECRQGHVRQMEGIYGRWPGLP